MIVDIYKKSEPKGMYSYLAVPNGKEIPQEVINTDWLNDNKNVELDNDLGEVFHIKKMESQIEEKGYAISNNRNYINIGPEI